MRTPPPAGPRGKNTKGLSVDDQAARAVRRGHPWVYREAVRGPLESFRAGDTAVLTASDGTFLARAVIEPASALAARVLTLDPRDDSDRALVERKLRAAVGRRAALIDRAETTALRLCNGEGDGLPGLVLDRYDRWGVLRADGEAALVFARRHQDAIRAALGDEVDGVMLRPRDGSPEAWIGPAAPPTVVVREHGMAMHVDLHEGQKTGAFLDQRDNRRRVRQLSPGRRVLNLFSYAGGFSIAAALGGASQVTSVDIAAGGHAAAQRSMRDNGLDPTIHRFVTADVFAFLTAARARGDRWDLVISDPPSFAPNERTRPRAIGAYRKLHEACRAVLAPGALFAAASCSSHVGLDDFLSTLQLDPPDLHVAEIHGQPPDHAVTPSWPEGRYLKFIVLQRDEPR